MSRYAWYTRILAPLSALISAGFVAGAVGFGVNLWTKLRLAEPANRFVLLLAIASLVIVAIGVGAVFAVRAKVLLVFYQEYRIDGTLLSVYDPVSRQQCRMKLHDVIAIKSRFIYELNPRSLHARAHRLVARDGAQVTLMESLEIWPEIETICSGAPVEPFSTGFSGKRLEDIYL